MPFHPVVDRFWVAPQLDPISLAVFTALFAATALLTCHRPSWGALLLLFLAPFTWDHAVFGTTLSLPKVLLLGTLAGLLTNPGAFQALRRARLVLVAFGGIMLAIAISGVGAHYPGEVLRELFKWIEYALFFSAAYTAISADTNTKILKNGYFLSIALVCLTALAELFTGAASGIWIGGTSLPRVAGVLDGPNQLAGYLESSIAALAAFAIRRPQRSTLLLLVLALFTLTLTFSRAAFLGLVIIAIVLSVLERQKIFTSFVAACAGLILGALTIRSLLKHAPQKDVEQIAVRASDTTGSGAGGVGTRTELWRAAIYFFRHHPLTGVGAGNFERRLPEAGLPTIRTHANSWYLQALAEGGIVLFAATLFFIGSFLVLLWRNVRTSPWALAAFAATIALAVHQTVDYLVFYPKVAEPWILLCAIGIADSRSSR